MLCEFSDELTSWNGMERRHSTDSNDSSNCSKQGSDDVPAQGRVSKTTAPKPPANALQFVKTGPCNLYRKAQEQIKKAEEIKKDKTVFKYDAEEWQSNLDNWKSSRRKMQEHIIERVVEVKKLELEEHERNRKKTKTLSEMMQERGQKGRKASIPIYEDDSNDLSDLGLGNSKSSKNSDGMSSLGSLDEENASKDGQDLSAYSLGTENGCLSHDYKDLSSDDKDSTDEYKESSDENQNPPKKYNENSDYSYISPKISYSAFTDQRNKTRDLKSERPVVPVKPRRSLTCKAESDISKFDLLRKSLSSNDLSETSKKVLMPKVDINKRRELFEKPDLEEKYIKIHRSTVDLNSSKSIKERLSFLEKQSEMNKIKQKERPATDVSVKDRLTSIENLKTTEPFAGKVLPDESLSSKTIKDRLSSLEKASSNVTKSQSAIEASTPLKERLSSLQTACQKEIPKTEVPKVDKNFNEKLNPFQELEVNQCDDLFSNQETFNYSNEDLDGLYATKKQLNYCHRSLDSLDIDSVPSGSFERVQSYDDLEYCRNYPASSVSGDTDREDSGIHTADVSSSVSQADDFDLHLDTNLSDDLKVTHQPTIIEERKSKSPVGFVDNSFIRFEDSTNCSEGNETIEADITVISTSNSDIICPEETPESNIAPVVESFILKEKETNDIISTTNQILTSLVEDDFGTVRKDHIAPNQLTASLVVDMAVISDVAAVFPISPSALEPPKEKPPPPPVDLSDDDDIDDPHKPSPIRRLDSTKRIKKEIRLKRSSFLGLEGTDDSYLDAEVEGRRPPDVAALLAEEKRLERQLQRQSLCSETDSNQESRDSGVELDNRPLAPSHHSRENSDNLCNNSSTSEEDDIMRKEREIIETLEKEEMIRKQQLGEKLAMRLRELEVEKDEAEWERLHHEVNVNNEDKPVALDAQDCLGENRYKVDDDSNGLADNYDGRMWYEQSSDTETSRDGLEQRVPEPGQPPYAPNQPYRGQAVHQPQFQATPSPRPTSSHVHNPAVTPVNPYRHRNSYHDLPSRDPRPAARAIPPPVQPTRRSMPDLRPAPNTLRPPPPALPAKPPHLANQQSPHHSMSRQTLQALSAAPRSRIISSESWQAKQKPKQDQSYYQHWLIQEAEHRRITEQQMRQQQQGNWNRQQQQQQQQPQGENWNGWTQQRPTRPPPIVPSQWTPPLGPTTRDKPLPDSVIQTLTQRVQNRKSDPNNNRRSRYENVNINPNHEVHQQEKVLSVSGKKRCSACGEELGRGAAMIIESLQLFYHIECFKCCVCCLQLGDGLMGTDVRVRSNKLHCHNCYSSDDGVKFSCV